jgi:hypothetical protein
MFCARQQTESGLCAVAGFAGALAQDFNVYSAPAESVIEEDRMNRVKRVLPVFSALLLVLSAIIVTQSIGTAAEDNGEGSKIRSDSRSRRYRST